MVLGGRPNDVSMLQKVGGRQRPGSESRLGECDHEAGNRKIEVSTSHSGQPTDANADAAYAAKLPR